MLDFCSWGWFWCKGTKFVVDHRLVQFLRPRWRRENFFTYFFLISVATGHPYEYHRRVQYCSYYLSHCFFFSFLLWGNLNSHGEGLILLPFLSLNLLIGTFYYSTPNFGICKSGRNISFKFARTFICIIVVSLYSCPNIGWCLRLQHFKKNSALDTWIWYRMLLLSESC